MIGVIDYGMGNVGSILNMLKRIGAPSVATHDAEKLESCERLILPGVGAFDSAIQQLIDRGLPDVLNRLVVHGRRPILGICLGMQLMTQRSEEGTAQGLGWIPGETVRFTQEDDPNLKIPNMGWRHVELRRPSPIFATPTDTRRFYFVHSYHVRCNNPEHVVAVSRHGNEFVAAFQDNQIYGVQFHPEKSHRYGMHLLKDFAEAT